MNFIKNIKIGKRLALGFAVLLTLLMVVGGIAVSGLSKVHDGTSDLATNWLRATRSLADYEAALNAVRRAEALTVMAKSPTDLEQRAQRIAVAKSKSSEAWAQYQTTIDLPEEVRLAKAIEQGQAAYYGALEQSLLAARAGDRGTAEELYGGKSHEAFDQAMAAVAADVEFQSLGGAAAYDESHDAYAKTRALVVGTIVLAALVTIVVAWGMSVSIVRPIRRAVDVAATVAAGDLTSAILVDSRDEAGLLLGALQNMNESLAEIVGQVRDSADSIATGSVQIASGNADLSRRTEAQASSLQQTAASMEQLTAMVNQNVDTARQASQLACSATAAARQGGTVVAQVIETMHEINDSSRMIEKIIGIVDGIAFQTNILALNAAVEAARAGVQGRGFAVVAAEVRMLAQRSAQAAREIKVLVATSVEKVVVGSALVDEAGKSMNDIVSQVKLVSDLIAEISTSSDEQSRGIGQIGEAVTQLDQVTQQNAALVEESAAAAESLRQQSQQLSNTVAGFRLDVPPGRYARAPQ